MPTPGVAAPPIAVIMGVSGTGKTTLATLLAQALGWPSAEGDDFHSAANKAKMHSGHPLTDADRLPWLQEIAAWIHGREVAGSGGIITCSALKRSYRDILRTGNADVRFVCLVGSRELLHKRLDERQGHFMPAALLDSQLATLEPLGPDEPGVTIDVGGTPDQIKAAAIAALASPLDAN
jgi:gluconokinase